MGVKGCSWDNATPENPVDVSPMSKNEEKTLNGNRFNQSLSSGPFPVKLDNTMPIGTNREIRVLQITR